MLIAAQFAKLSSSSTMGVGLVAQGDTDPRAYLRYAEEDLAEGDSSRRRINALSNAKRALHLQIELLTNALGYSSWSERKARGFPRRLLFAEKCGMITPRVLSKVNRLRNDVEHEYADPDRDMVDDYTDVVALYLEASDRYVRSFPHIREVYTGKWKERTPYCLRTRRMSGVIAIYQCDSTALIRALPESDVPNPSSPLDEREPVGIDIVQSVSLADDGDVFFEWAHILLGVSGANDLPSTA